MSVLHPRCGKGRRSVLRNRDDNIIRTLTYHDSDEGELSPRENGDFVSCANLFSPAGRLFSIGDSDRMEDTSSEFLELDLPTPSPGSSPRSSRTIRRSRAISPIPLDEGNEGDVDDDEQRVPAPGTAILSPNTCAISPPHRRLRALRLFDTPHTPKSLLQRARRRRLTDERRKRTPPSSEKVEANFNPFTPNNNRPHLMNTNMKRNRTQMERYATVYS